MDLWSLQKITKNPEKHEVSSLVPKDPKGIYLKSETLLVSSNLHFRYFHC